MIWLAARRGDRSSQLRRRETNGIMGANRLNLRKKRCTCEAPIILVVLLLLLAASTCLQAQTKSRTESQNLPPSPLSAEELFRLVSPSVFTIEALGEDGLVVARGSGVAVGPIFRGTGRTPSSFEELDRFLAATRSTLIVTNTHVIDPGVSIRVRQGSKTWSAGIEHIDLHADLCRLRVNEFLASAVPLRSLGTLAIGERVYAVGAPEGLELTFSEGLISGLRELDGESVIQTTAPVSHGSSGGGLFDAHGRLVGVTTFMLRGGQNLNFALPTDSLLKPHSEHAEDPFLLSFFDRHLDLIERHRRTRISYSKAASKFGDETIDRALTSARLAELAIKRNPADWEAHFILGSSVFWWDYHRAVLELSEAVRLKPDEAEAHAQLGVALNHVGDPYGAIRELTEAVHLAPGSYYMHLRLMNTLMDSDSTLLALREAREVARLEPNLARFDVFFPVALWMQDMGDAASAVALCKEMVNVEHSKADGHFCLGTVLMVGTQKEWLAGLSSKATREQSIAEFREAIRLDPNRANFHHTLAIALQLNGQYDEALEEYRRASGLAPGDATFKADYERALRESEGKESHLDRPN